MASIFVSSDPYSEIDYSLIDGRVRSFVLRAQKMYDEADGTADPLWKEKLVELVKHQGLDVYRGEAGLPKFIYWMQDEGLLPAWEYRDRPAFETWCWVTDGESVWIAKHAQHIAANGWTNEDTWEDFDKSVIAWIPIETPEIPPGKERT